MISEDALFCYDPPDSVWELISKDIADAEVDEIKGLLGNNLVDESLDLRNEVEMLLSIWREMKDEAVANMSPRLPEPPQLRQMLMQEISFFIQTLRSKSGSSSRAEREPDLCLSRQGTEVVDFVSTRSVSTDSGVMSRPLSAISSRDGRETPLRRSADSPTKSLTSNLSDEISQTANREDLSYLKFDRVVEHLRQVLQDEVVQLRSDVSFLQSCLDEEKSQEEFDLREPTLTDLKQTRTELEHKLLVSAESNTSLLTSERTTSPFLTPPVARRLPSISQTQSQNQQDTSRTKSANSTNSLLVTEQLTMDKRNSLPNINCPKLSPSPPSSAHRHKAPISFRLQRLRHLSPNQ